MKLTIMAGAIVAAVTLSGAAAASVTSDAANLMPRARSIADPYARGLATGWLDVATHQDGLVTVSSNFNDAATRALNNARHFIDGSVPFQPIYHAKQWPADTRPVWIDALRKIDTVNERAGKSPCRDEAAGRLSALTDEAWKEQEETHGTRWVHGWDSIERAKQLAEQVARALDACRPPAPPVVELKPVVLSGDALFAFDSAVLTAQGEQTIAALAQQLRQARLSNLTVTGYTDRFGDVTYNKTLSLHRASAVARVLAANGVRAAHAEVVGAGPIAPIADCPGPKSPAVIACLARNRRVEIRATGIELPQMTDRAAKSAPAAIPAGTNGSQSSNQ
ncbi:OOP family OmpA-OmpF porin [Burkholderia diffusa]|uniref:OmpA family protein n=1 Tax=Burkholderia diffusa TaxID=488732 RepID=UPI001CB26010|nr:OmpA family protein [Burkholderia diffusa]CAG9264391.1 OOP family OmpA-OmpF porin [Burkholderia diffusa]